MEKLVFICVIVAAQALLGCSDPDAAARKAAVEGPGYTSSAEEQVEGDAGKSSKAPKSGKSTEEQSKDTTEK